jgi:hypothetical protein
VFDVVLVDDASPEEGMRALCAEYKALLNAHLIAHEENRGFVVSVNEAMRETSGDVVLLNSDTVVPTAWLSRLKAAADANPKAATVTPFSNNATICSYPHFVLSSPLPCGLSLEVIDGIVREVNHGQVAEIPTAVGFCMYIRRAALQEVGLFDEDAFGRGYGEENEWCCRASAAGWQHLLAADVFVYHEGGVSFGDEGSALQSAAIEILNERYPDYSGVVQRFIENDPLRDLRRNIDGARVKIPGQADVLLVEAAQRVDLLQHDARRYRQLEQSTRQEYESRCSQYELLLKEARDASAHANSQIRELEAYLAEARAAYAEACDQIRALEVTQQHLESQWGLRLQRKLESIRGIS